MLRTIMMIITLLMLATNSADSPFAATFGPTAGGSPIALAPPTATTQPIATPPPRPQPTETASVLANLSAVTDTASLVRDTDTPKADQFSITQRLRLHSSSPLPRTVDRGVDNYPVGHQQQFWMSDIAAKRYYTITATLIAVSEHAYMYVQDGYKVSKEAVKQALDDFEQHIYLINRQYFGQEPNPGVDGDPHITILNAQISGAGGYFSAADAYPKVITRFSNEQELIYIGTSPAQTQYYLATIAHEFQHMIHFNENPAQSVWLNEGASELAMFLNGYDVGGTDYVFAVNPDVQLNGWASQPDKSIGHYGAAYLFLRYLSNLYGPDFVREMNRSRLAGPASINYALNKVGPRTVMGANCGTDFDGTFKFWVVANFVNKLRTADPCYGYDDQLIGVQKIKTISQYPNTVDGSLSQYAAAYYDLRGSAGDVTINFRGAAKVPVISTAPPSGSRFWWSNRDDSLDSTLTREFDLSSVSGPASLEYKAWYDLERDYDYAYVLASDDGGTTWRSLAATSTTTKDPNGTNYGNAYTGISGQSSGDDASKGVWQAEQVDLSAYVGKKVLLRFECITDQAYNAQGFALDDLQLAAVGYRDDAATAASGWQAEGFVRIEGQMPQHYFVQVVKLLRDGSLVVADVPLDGDNQGSLTVSDLGGAVKQAVVIVAPYAPKTTVAAQYTLEFTR